MQSADDRVQAKIDDASNTHTGKTIQLLESKLSKLSGFKEKTWIGDKSGFSLGYRQSLEHLKARQSKIGQVTSSFMASRQNSNSLMASRPRVS